ncbi:MAG TPA: hypothetical protein VMZ06_07520 [Candidatus Bathyarchaeia archaeon]|nr:hypothetical protein [Candidatus Bathyarchaeia archaeon]
MPVLLALVLVSIAQPGPVLGVQDGQFTLDGRLAFLLGCSYYGALGVNDEAALEADLNDLERIGFNWIRVWATWNAFGNDTSVLTADGAPNARCLDRLTRLCEMAGKRGMVVEVTVSRGEDDCFPHDVKSHLAVVEQLARTVKPFRNVYFDLGNERNVRDGRYVPMGEVAKLAAAVKAIDPERVCTASNAGGDLEPEKATRYMTEGRVDFIAPHRHRDPETPAGTEAYTRSLRRALEEAGRVVPVHFQEPFRRGYQDWAPSAEDFMRDLEGARDGGAAGWCFHNGATRSANDGRPRRSFDMRRGEGRLFAQLDAEELRFFRLLEQQNSKSDHAVVDANTTFLERALGTPLVSSEGILTPCQGTSGTVKLATGWQGSG